MAYDDQEIYGYVDEGEDISGNVESGDDLAGEIDDYIKGDPGVGIESMAQIQSASESGGMNIWRATLSDGTVHDFVVRNGLQGAAGAKGDPGPEGPAGPKGDPGEGIATGGTPGQALIKASTADYATRWMSILPEDTASGAVASFPDGADDLPMGVVVDIDPVQDLHGYDNPWPGGGVKNKLPLGTKASETISGVTANLEDGVITLSGTATADIWFVFPLITPVDLSPSTNKIVFLNSASNSVTVNFRRSTSTIHFWQMAPVNRVASDWTDTGNEVVDNVMVRVASGTDASMTISPMLIATAETDYTYAPYSNVCPISGRTGAKVTRTGRNLLPFPYADDRKTIVGVNVTVNDDGTITFDGTPSGATMFFNISTANFDPIVLKPGTYTLSNGGIAGYSSRITAVKNGAYFAITSTIDGKVTFTLTEPAVFNFYISTPNGTALNNLIVKPQLEIGSSATAYEPYQGETYNIEFPIGTGTVYGGTLDVVTGELVVDRAIVDLATGMSGGTAGGNYVFFKQLQNALTVPNSQIADIIAEAYKPIRFNAIASTSYHIALRDNGVIYVNTGSADVQPVGNAVYKLATPITLTLDPVEMRSLLGDNNVWADTGDVSVTYHADIQKYIDKKISAAVAAMS